MSAKKLLIKNSSLNLIGYGYLLIASFFSISILLNHLGRDLFGLYLFLAAIVPLASVFDLGLGNACVRRLSLSETTEDEKQKTWRTSLFIYLILATLLFFIIILLSYIFFDKITIFQITPKITIYLSIVVLAITVFINHLNSCFLNLAQAHQRFDIFNLKTLFVGTANTLLSAFTSYFTTEIYLIFLVQLIFHLVTLGFLIRYFLTHQTRHQLIPQYDKTTSRALINFGVRDFVGTLSSQIEAQFSKYALGTLISAAAISAFTIPQTIVLKAAGAVSQIAIAFFPFSTSLLKKEKIKKLTQFILTVELLTLLGGLIAVFLTYNYTESFLLWWLKDPVIVSLSFPILKIMVLYFLLIALTPIPTVIVQAINYPQVSSFFSLLTTAIEIFLILYLIPIYSIIGVAYAALISATITVPPFLIIVAILLRKKFKQLEQ
jgi:O-antigen/teichoic acid export membrane protein